jgi:hypothetical protein
MNAILERVNEVCKTVREKNTSLTTFKKLITQIRSTFKKHELDLTIKTKREKDWDSDKWYIMGYYDAEDDLQGESPIEIVVHHNLNGNEEFGPHQVTAFLTEIYDATVHEYRHQYQSIRRGFKEFEEHCITPYDEYLSNQDEMDAYAMSIAIELLRTMDVNRAIRNMSRISIMSKMRTGSSLSSPMLRVYVEHFGSSNIMKRMAKKIYFHLETIDKRYIFM